MGKANHKKGNKSVSKVSVDSNSNDRKDQEEPTANRPRNFYVTDATHPFRFAFKGRFGLHHALTIHQTPDEETWPGGALWDLGVLLSNLLLGMAGVTLATTSTVMESSPNNNKVKSKNHNIQLPAHLAGGKNAPDWLHSIILSEKSIILELGTGVGLTGLAAAAALRPSLVLLTDLQVVVEKVTQRNIEENTQAQKRHRLLGKTMCIGHPLCWGLREDEEAVAGLIEEYQLSNASSSSSKRKTKKKQSSNQQKIAASTDDQSNRLGKPDIILIGDVAYQHKPGAPSHFEALHSTLLQFLHADTIVIFGTRIRMPASNDLLTLFLEDLEPLIPPIPADELEPLFGSLKHNMSIHFLRRRKVATEPQSP
uniref:Calmodulin-lysine N-methyltransferase n=1 Tax=Entomoneis paludosa TaxID=265537 RepID=A0A7S2YCN9_9STRA